MTQHTHSNSELDVSERVVAAVADARDLDPLELPPLYNVIDPDALNKLFDRADGGEAGPGRVVFMMANCEVLVHSDGEVEANAADDQSSAAAESVAEQDAAEQILD